jgi:hypothetical protein
VLLGTGLLQNVLLNHLLFFLVLPLFDLVRCMLRILLEADTGDHLYHIHNVWSIGQVAFPTFCHFHQVIPDKSANREGSCSRQQPSYQIWCKSPKAS